MVIHRSGGFEGLRIVRIGGLSGRERASALGHCDRPGERGLSAGRDLGTGGRHADRRQSVGEGGCLCGRGRYGVGAGLSARHAGSQSRAGRDSEVNPMPSEGEAI